MNKNKKGFTIVELVIVIAIIAILAAILIPTFGSVIRTAQTSADVHLVKNLNIALSTAEVLHGRNNTMYDALADAFDAGYDIRKLTPTNADNEILWDQTCDRFVLYVNEEYDVCGRYVDKAVPTGGDTYKLWKIYTDSNLSEHSEAGANDKENYSIYWNGTAENAPATVSVGFDAGTANVASITYENDSAKDVVIRTTGGTLTVNAPQDEVTHFGSADYVDIIAVKPASYEENGTVSLVKVAKGNVSLTSDAKVGQIHLAKTGNEFTQIKITLETGAKLPDLSRDSVGTSIGETPVLVCEVASVGTSEFYWLSGNGTIEDEKVLVSTSANGEKTAATAENSTAVAIANAKTGEEVTDTGISVNTAEEIAEVTAQGAAKTFAEIGSKEELLAFRDAWNAGKLAGGTFKLTANIDISGEDWLPIGTWEFPFNGTFDGNNKTINGLYANSTDAEHQGLYSNGDTVGFGETFGFFGIVGNGDTVVKDVSFTNVNINIYDGKDVGVVIGYVPNLEKFKAANASGEDKFMSVDKWTDESGVGTHTLTLDGITVSGSVTGKAHVSGLVGKKYASGKFVAENCYSYVTIKSSGDSCGGLFGYLKLTSDSIIKGCYNYGTVTSSGAWTGGIVGYIACLNANSELVIEDCHNYGTINLQSNNSRKGLILGNISSSNFTSLTFKNCTSEVESTECEVNADNFTNNDLGDQGQTKFKFVNE